MRKLTNNGSKAAAPILNVGIDIGYGVTKALTSDTQIAFPSVAGYAREIKFQSSEIANKYPGDQVHDDEGHWFVGDLALSQLGAGEQRRLRGRTANEGELGNVFRARLARVAIGKLLPVHEDVVHLRIATGLPVDHMRDADALKVALGGQHVIHTDQANFIANVTQVMVMPQPYGTIYSQRLTDQGSINKCHTFTRVGVVDVGTYTVDLALDDSGEYIDGESGSVESGVWTAQERIATAIERDYREKPALRVVEGVLRSGCLRAAGETVDYSREVEEALAPLRSATMELIATKWKGGLNVDVIYVSGGGAELVIGDIKAYYRQAVLVDGAQMANARGYLNYALFAQG
ncbi:MAG: ParM/StbA family protein [Chloroflexota bacterium]|nr:ParM/StbA family protein [Chloroflexota bacterium]